MLNYFAILGLETRIALDPKLIEKQFIDKQRSLQSAAAGESEQITSLTQAFETLRTPLGRFQHFLHLKGIEEQSESAGGYLAKLMSAYEEFEDADVNDLESMKAELELDFATDLDEADTAAEEGEFAELPNYFAQLKYSQRLIDVVDKKLGEIHE